MIGETIFRLVLLMIVAYLGAVVFYSRRDLEPKPLLALAAGRAVVVSAWTVGAFVFMSIVEWAFINS